MDFQVRILIAYIHPLATKSRFNNGSRIYLCVAYKYIVACWFTNQLQEVPPTPTPAIKGRKTNKNKKPNQTITNENQTNPLDSKATFSINCKS